MLTPTAPCPACTAVIAKRAAVCPHCGEPYPHKVARIERDRRRGAVLVLVGLGIAALFGAPEFFGYFAATAFAVGVIMLAAGSIRSIL